MKRRRVRTSNRVGLRRFTLIVLGTTRMRSPPAGRAPREAGLVACRFCKTPFVQNVQTDSALDPPRQAALDATDKAKTTV